MNIYKSDLHILEAETIANQIFYMIVPFVKHMHKLYDNKKN
jgi:hypothetical protein